MVTKLDLTPAERYHSGSQRARAATEGWAANNMFCLACPSPHLRAMPVGYEVIDFVCPRREAPYQLKSSSRRFGARVVDGAYSAMLRAIKADSTPHLLFLQYSLLEAAVLELFLVPRFALTLSCLEQRSPLRDSARRAGWVGCNILLRNLPPETRITLIGNGRVVSKRRARAGYQRTLPIQKLNADQRGWTLDVLKVVSDLGKERFSLQDIYSKEAYLAALHPMNHNIQPKIRQQLQILRDMGLVEFTAPGQYRFL